MKKLFFLFLLFPVQLFAQEGKTYITHTVTAKETLYSLGRQFNIHPKEIAAYNNLDFAKGLTIGQVIKIPTSGSPAPNVAAPQPTASVPAKTVEEKKPVAAAKRAPVYHKVQKKETLYAISVKYGKVPIADIKKWNNLTSDGLNEGMNLIVGYTEKAAVPASEEKTVAAAAKKEEPVLVQKTVPEPPVAKVEEKKAEPVVVQKEEKPIPKQETPVIKTQPSVTGQAGGFFRTKYNSSDKRSEETGTASVFKSTSGWEDGKYYCLHNKATAGSVIKITNLANQKTVYAKVLDVIPDLKQNAKVALVVSNAAAEELGAGENNFECSITY